MVVGDGQQVDIPVLPEASERSSDTEGEVKRVDGRARPSTEAVEIVKYVSTEAGV